MGTTRSDDGKLANEVRDLAMDTTVAWLRHLHELAGEGLPGGPSAGPSDRRTVGNLAMELAERGVELWRGLLDVQRRFSPELLHVAGGGALRAAAAGEELVAVEGALRLKLQGSKVEATLHLHNRSRAWVDVLLPTTLLLTRHDALDRVLLDVTAVPAAPVLGPGDALEVEITLTAPTPPARDVPNPRFYGELRVDSRGPLRVALPVELTIA